MLDEKDNKGKSKVNFKKFNEVLGLTKKVLNIVYFLCIVISVFVIVKVCQELKVINFVLDILGILAPLFLGIMVAWLFNPFVKFLQKKGVKRVFGVIIVYVLFIGVLATLICTIIPILYDQILSFAESMPNLIAELETSLNKFLNVFKRIDGLDIEELKSNLMAEVEKYGTSISSDVPKYVVSVAKGIVEGITTFVVGLVIGFFLLLGFDNIGDTLIVFFPKKWRKDVNELATRINASLHNYVIGVIVDAIIIFIICSIAFSFTGLKAPLLFALFCAITNVIPYVGPYIGAVPALIVAFSMSPTIGLFTLIAIVVIQFIEGNFLQDVILAKTTNLHPVTIIIGLLLFGHFLGILGMAISTPIIAVMKQIFMFANEKFNLIEGLNSDDDEPTNKKEVVSNA